MIISDGPLLLKPAWLVYGGNREMQNGNVTIIPWRILAKLSVQLGI